MSIILSEAYLSTVLIFDKIYVKIVFVLWPRRLAWSRTLDFHSSNTGSNPVEAASYEVDFSQRLGR